MDFELITLNGADGFVRAVAHSMQKLIHEPHITYFADGELEVLLKDPAIFRDKTVVLMQSTGYPVHEHIMQVAFLAHELKNAGVKKIIGVIPYFGYSRQERSAIIGKNGNAQVIARLIENAGIDELISVELHASILTSFFSIPVHNIALYSQLAAHIKKEIIREKNGSMETQCEKEIKNNQRDICLIAPDVGAVERVAHIAQMLGMEFLVFEKQRHAPDITNVVSCVGNCRGKTAVIIDDIIDTGGTVVHVAQELKQKGFEEIYGYFVHPVLSDGAIEKLNSSLFTKIYVTNTLDILAGKKSEKIVVLDVSADVVAALVNIQ